MVASIAWNCKKIMQFGIVAFVESLVINVIEIVYFHENVFRFTKTFLPS